TTTTTTTTRATTTTTTTRATTTTTTTTRDTTTTTTTTRATTTTTTTTTKATASADSGMTKNVVLNRTISLSNNTLTIPASELVSSSEIIEKMEITLSVNADQIQNYNLGMYMNMADNSVFQQNLTGYTENNVVTLTIDVPQQYQVATNEYSNMNLGYWWGNNQEITVESIKISYRTEGSSETSSKGDVDQNGEINAADVELLRQFMVGAYDHSDASVLEHYDINEDGQLNVFDCIILERIVG
ncbi:MAG: hypothetical protein IJA12_04215, partial [Oscillospiraceae bacterium]|nr:hypothetical protein [Oscillospiraceae bacterium]